MLGENRIPECRVDAIGFERRIVLQIDRLGIAALQAIERRLRDGEKTPFNEARHLAEGERQQQGADGACGYIRCGHDDDSVVARLCRGRMLAAASTSLATTFLASAGWSSMHCVSLSATMPSMTGRTSEETSLSLVCDENFGSGTLADRIQVKPSRMSSPDSVTFSFLAMPLSLA